MCKATFIKHTESSIARGACIFYANSCKDQQASDYSKHYANSKADSHCLHHSISTESSKILLFIIIIPCFDINFMLLGSCNCSIFIGWHKHAFNFKYMVRISYVRLITLKDGCIFPNDLT